MPGGPSPDDWILEEHYHNDEAYLLDRMTSKLFTNPGENAWPRPVGECIPPLAFIGMLWLGCNTVLFVQLGPFRGLAA